MIIDHPPLKIIDRYIAQVIMAGTVTALLLVVGLDAFFSLIGQIDDVGGQVPGFVLSSLEAARRR